MSSHSNYTYIFDLLTTTKHTYNNYQACKDTNNQIQDPVLFNETQNIVKKIRTVVSNTTGEKINFSLHTHPLIDTR